MVTKYAQAWSIQESDCPSPDNLLERLRFLVGYAVLAPSGWNSQPWRFHVTEQCIELFDDPERGQDHRDPDGRERITSCGAAIYNLQLALRRFGIEAKLELCPTTDDPRLLAVIHIVGSCPEDKDNPYFKAILQRHCYRKPFDETPVSDDIITEMQKAATHETVEFIPITCNSVQIAMAGMVAEGDRDLGADEATRKEYASWVRRGDNQGDGVPGYALGLGKVESILAPVTRRVFNYTDENAHKDRELTCDCPMLGVIATKNDTPKDWLVAGIATQRILLAAAANQLMASFMNQPIPVPELRQRLRILVGTENWPQTVLRFGYTQAVIKPTPRRPLEDVLV